MEDRDVTLDDLQGTLKDIKQHIRWLYDIMNWGVTEGSSTAEELKWMAWQMGNHETRIEDNHRYLHELMGTIGYMKEDLQKLVNMNQSSHIHDSPIRDQEMEETSVIQPIKDPKGKQRE